MASIVKWGETVSMRMSLDEAHLLMDALVGHANEYFGVYDMSLHVALGEALQLAVDGAVDDTDWSLWDEEDEVEAEARAEANRLLKERLRKNALDAERERLVQNRDAEKAVLAERRAKGLPPTSDDYNRQVYINHVNDMLAEVAEDRMPAIRVETSGTSVLRRPALGGGHREPAEPRAGGGGAR